MRLSLRSKAACEFILLTLLSSCAGLAQTPIGSEGTPAPTATWPTLPTRPPTATAWVFELQPTFTLAPSPTLISLQGGLDEATADAPPDRNPLTGLRISDPSLLERRPMAIKITNFPRSVRPQWGLTAADHIYEYFLEDELTRFIAIYYGTDAERVGPIRSARPFDERIVRMYKAIFAFAFADDRLIGLWEDSDLLPYLVIERPGNCPPMCRIGLKTAYNTLFTDTHLLTEYVTNRKIEHGRQALTGLKFAAQAQITQGGGEANRVEIRFSPMSYNYWEYNPASSRYYRWQDADRVPAGQEIYEPLIDSLTNKQVSADNLIILYVPIKYFFKSNSTEIFDFELSGEGVGYALREGRIFAIRWKKPAVDSLISLSFPNGVTYPLKPGNVWFEILSDSSSQEVNQSTWRFQFSIPSDLLAPTPTPKKKRSP